jgi:putative endonuclease
MAAQIAKLGKLGEDLVAHWLKTQGWIVLERGWHCRWGELDIIARRPENSPTQARRAIELSNLAFVEVKTRSRGNWDADGLLAITPQKQIKLYQAAQLFLVENPTLTELSCRFDVALVCCQRSPNTDARTSPAKLGRQVEVSSQRSPSFALPDSLKLGQSVSLAGYQLSLQTYLESAFTV